MRTRRAYRVDRDSPARTSDREEATATMLKAATGLHPAGLLAVALCALTLAACDTPTPVQEPSPPPTADAAPAPTVTAPAPVPTERRPRQPPLPTPSRPTPHSRRQPSSSLRTRSMSPSSTASTCPASATSLNLQSALMAHTCKPGADDEIFVVGQPAPGNLSMPAYNRCMEAEGAEPQAQLHLQECSDAAMQQFGFDADGALSPVRHGPVRRGVAGRRRADRRAKPRAPRPPAAGLRRGDPRPEPVGLPRTVPSMTSPIIPRAALSPNLVRTPEQRTGARLP